MTANVCIPQRPWSKLKASYSPAMNCSFIALLTAMSLGLNENALFTLRSQRGCAHAAYKLFSCFLHLKMHFIALLNLSFIICARGTQATFCNLGKTPCIARRPPHAFCAQSFRRVAPGGEFSPLSFVRGWWWGGGGDSSHSFKPVPLGRLFIA